MGKQTSIVPVKTVEQHASQIRTAMSKSIEGFIQVGQRVLEAQGELEDGDFKSLFNPDSKDYVGMAERQGYRFLAIAKGSKLLLKYQNDIPQDVTQLDAISRLSDDEIKSAIKEGVLSPAMGRGDLSKWLKSKEPDPDQADPDQMTIEIGHTEVEQEEPQQSVEVDSKQQILDAVDVLLAYAQDKAFQVKLINSLRKKWDISITDLT